MGWKNVKEHYRIGHIVQVTDAGICIGSPYIHNIIVIGKDGKVKKRYDGCCNDDLSRYQAEMDTDPTLLRMLVQQQDSFGKLVKVYTHSDGDVIEKWCEKIGWPNITCDGELMHDNTFSTDKQKVVEWAKKEAEAVIRLWQEQKKSAKDRLLKCQLELDRHRHNLFKLESLGYQPAVGNAPAENHVKKKKT